MPLSFMPNLEKLKAKFPEKRFCQVEKRMMDQFKSRGWIVTSDPSKEKPTVEGQLPPDTTIQTHDTVCMEIGGKAKERWESERKEAVHAQQEEINEKHRRLSETGQFEGTITRR
jgi:hypothetical protein